MGRRKILKVQDRQKLFDVPADEDSLIRHHSLTAADRLEIDLRRRDHNKLGFDATSRSGAGGRRSLPRAMLKYVADQIGADPPRLQPMPAGKRRGAITLRA